MLSYECHTRDLEINAITSLKYSLMSSRIYELRVTGKTNHRVSNPSCIIITEINLSHIQTVEKLSKIRISLFLPRSFEGVTYYKRIRMCPHLSKGSPADRHVTISRAGWHFDSPHRFLLVRFFVFQLHHEAAL